MAAMKKIVVDGLIRSSSSQLFKPNNLKYCQYQQLSSLGGLKQSLKKLQEDFLNRCGETKIRDKQNNRALDFEEKMSSLYLASSVVEPHHDFLRANYLGKNSLLGGLGGKLPPVDVESLRGKNIILYFSNLKETHVPCVYIEVYYSLKRTNPEFFEMIYVAPLPAPLPRAACSSNFHDYISTQKAIISHLSWLAVPLDDLEWISELRNFYSVGPFATSLTVIDPRDNEIKGSLPICRWSYLMRYGPQFYPFSVERGLQLDAQLQQLGKETSIEAILGSDSRDYLIDHQSNKVPISSLQDKDVLLFFYTKKTAQCNLPYVKRLEEIYIKFRNHSFEIVCINLDHNGGNERNEKSWKNHLAQIPWLHLPPGDEKIWFLRTMMTDNVCLREPESLVLFVKPKGESLLDPYGCPVFEKFGIQAFPFTRKAAAHCLQTRLKGISFKSFVDKACHLGHDFNSLIRNKVNGGTEHVSLSTILEKRARGILLLFASLETCSQERLKSLINVYLSQNESSSFEVIFVSMDKDTQSFDDHFSAMPWFAFQRPLKRLECKKLTKTMAQADFCWYSHFFAFGPDQLLLQAGLLTKSFENCEFPFINDAESIDHLAYCLTLASEWWQEADGTRFNDGDGWWKGIEFEYIWNSDDDYSDSEVN